MEYHYLPAEKSKPNPVLAYGCNGTMSQKTDPKKKGLGGVGCVGKGMLYPDAKRLVEACGIVSGCFLVHALPLVVILTDEFVHEGLSRSVRG